MDILTSQLGWNATQGAGYGFAAAATPATPVWGADLYTGTDVSALNMFEKAWMNWYIWIGNPVIATGLMSFLLHGELHCTHTPTAYTQCFTIKVATR